jgi:hypothetical protein
VPMGGMQVVFCGDFFQLPPVSKSPQFTFAHWGASNSSNGARSTVQHGAAIATAVCRDLPGTQQQHHHHQQQHQDEVSLSQACSQQAHEQQATAAATTAAAATAVAVEGDYSRRFCFQSPVWSELIQQSFDLAQIFRQQQRTQGDADFIAALNAMRRGVLTEQCRDLLAPCVGRSLDCSDGILPTQIFTHKYVLFASICKVCSAVFDEFVYLFCFFPLSGAMWTT